MLSRLLWMVWNAWQIQKSRARPSSIMTWGHQRSIAQATESCRGRTGACSSDVSMGAASSLRNAGDDVPRDAVESGFSLRRQLSRASQVRTALSQRALGGSRSALGPQKLQHRSIRDQNWGFGFWILPEGSGQCSQAIMDLPSGGSSPKYRKSGASMLGIATIVVGRYLTCNAPREPPQRSLGTRRRLHRPQ